MSMKAAGHQGGGRDEAGQLEQFQDGRVHLPQPGLLLPQGRRLRLALGPLQGVGLGGGVGLGAAPDVLPPPMPPTFRVLV